jgi:hypothetical protein
MSLEVLLLGQAHLDLSDLLQHRKQGVDVQNGLDPIHVTVQMLCKLIIKGNVISCCYVLLVDDD